MIKNKRGSALPVVLGVFVLVSTFAFISFTSVYSSIATTNRVMELSENEFQAHNNIEIIYDILVARDGEFTNLEFLLETFGAEIEGNTIFIEYNNGRIVSFDVDIETEIVLEDITFEAPGNANPGPWRRRCEEKPENFSHPVFSCSFNEVENITSVRAISSVRSGNRND